MGISQKDWRVKEIMLGGILDYQK